MTVAVVLQLGAVVLVGIAVFLPWWTITYTGTTPETTRLNSVFVFYLGTVCTGGSCYNLGQYGDVAVAFGLTAGLLEAGLGISIVSLASIFLSAFRPRYRLVALAIGILGAAVVLAAPLYIFGALVPALHSLRGYLFVTSFFGSYSQPGNPITVAWGGDLGWTLALVGAILGAASSAVAFFASRSLAASKRA